VKRKRKEDAVVVIKHIKEKVVGSLGSISGVASILGSWQICHNICLGLIALLSVIGITLTGMPLEFFTKIAVPVWSIAVVLLAITTFLFFHKKCISKKLLIFNTGLIIAGTPFLQNYSGYFLSIGGLIAATGAALFVKDRLADKNKQVDFVSLVLYAILAVALVVLIMTLFSSFEGNAIVKSAAENRVAQKVIPLQADDGFKRITTGTTSDGEVEISLKPHKVEKGKLEVDFASNTHSVEMNEFDLLKITTLEYDRKTIKPLSAPKLSGHHVSGKLVFDVDKEIKGFTINIKGIPKIEERVFEWR
jgi:FlaG/FlaF family flagellin (archaellin)